MATAEIQVQLDFMQRELMRLRDRDHTRVGEVSALRTLAEVGAEQRAELIKDVAALHANTEASIRELRAEVTSGFGRRDRFARWAAGLAILGVPGWAVVIVDLLK